jgi:hypothetical protein
MMGLLTHKRFGSRRDTRIDRAAIARDMTTQSFSPMTVFFDHNFFYLPRSTSATARRNSTE